MNEGETITMGGCYCRGCGYDLRESRERCPECGRAFDRANPRSFFHSSPAHRRRLWLKRISLLLLVLILPPALGVGWLVWGWRAEQKYLAVLNEAGWRVKHREPLYRWLPECLPARWAFLVDRAGWLELPSGRLSDEDAQRLARLTRLVSLTLSSTAATDEDLHRLHSLTKLRAIYAGGRGISDDGLARLAERKGLIALSLSNASITGPGLRHLKAMTQLHILVLSGTPLDDEGLAHISGLKELTILSLAGTSITDAGLKHLAGLTQIKVLAMNGTSVGDEGLQHLAGMANLHWLGLENTPISDAGLEHLRTLQNLRDLKLAGTRVTPIGVQRLEAARPRLVIAGLPRRAPATAPARQAPARRIP